MFGRNARGGFEETWQLFETYLDSEGLNELEKTKFESRMKEFLKDKGLNKHPEILIDPGALLWWNPDENRNKFAIKNGPWKVLPNEDKKM